MEEHSSPNGALPLSFEGYSYRTSARFGSRVWLTIDTGVLTVVGPRLGIGMYRYWIGAQAFFLFTTVLAALAAIALLEWRWLLVGALSLGLHGVIGGVGAGCLWELSNLIAFGKGTRGDTLSMPLDQIKGIAVGRRAWARRGMRLLILPEYPMIDLSTSDCVSFEGPDRTNAQGVYAIHMRDHAEAERLAAALQGARESAPATPTAA